MKFYIYEVNTKLCEGVKVVISRFRGERQMLRLRGAGDDG